MFLISRIMVFHRNLISQMLSLLRDPSAAPCYMEFCAAQQEVIISRPEWRITFRGFCVFGGNHDCDTLALLRQICPDRLSIFPAPEINKNKTARTVPHSSMIKCALEKIDNQLSHEPSSNSILDQYLP